jgi:uncharacterized membrane protein
MKRQTLISFIVALALLGLLDALYLAHTAMSGGSLACDVNGLDGCNTVAQSPYSYLFGLPLGVYGAVFYAIFIALALFALMRASRLLDRLLALLALVGVVASVKFLYIQLVLIQAVCIYCLASAAVAGLLGIAAYLLVRRGPPPRETAPLPPSA